MDKALHYKRLFNLLSAVSILALALATALTGMNDGSGAMKGLIIICTAITSVVTSFLTFSKCREKWTLYCTTIEFIKRELSLYWGGNCKDEKLQELVMRLEDVIALEQKEWIELFREMDEADSKKNNHSQVEADKGKQEGDNDYFRWLHCYFTSTKKGGDRPWINIYSQLPALPFPPPASSTPHPLLPALP